MIKDMPKRFRNILLTGMPGSGKSCFGRVYALYSGRYFLDFDKYVELITKRKIADIFQQDGEQAYREIESSVLRRLEKKHNYVIALGGGTLASEAIFDFARRLGLIVWIHASAPTLTQRILAAQQNKATARPAFEGLNTPEAVLQKVTELWESRHTVYEQAYIHLNSDFSSIDNLKLQLGLYEKKNIERTQNKDRDRRPQERHF